MQKKFFNHKIKMYINSMYSGKIENSQLPKVINQINKIFKDSKRIESSKFLWNQEDFLLITYADSIKKNKQKNLKTLNDFLCKFCKEFKLIHILPFFPFSSDDGFAVIDYEEINDEHGSWSDVKKIGTSFSIMMDLVINHCSSQHKLFKSFLKDKSYIDYFIVSKKKFDENKKIVRPRNSSLSKKVNVDGDDYFVWCTFSHDQIDFNFKNPKVLIFFLKIIKFYIDNKAKALRLDAVAFLWKQFGTRCINLPETHDIIRLIRLIIEYYYGDILIITETNIPSHENLSYFGNNNEAHCIYNFSLAPLLIHSIISANSSYLKKWSRSMPPAQENNAYLNFLSTHDGIGMRPLEGVLPEEEVNKYIEFLKKSGALLTHRKHKGKDSVYEVNITLMNALTQTYHGKDNYHLKRFLLAHTILFSMEGIPAVYIQNLFGTENDFQKVKQTNINRSINRKNWDYDMLVSKLQNKSSKNYRVFFELKKIITLRKKQAAFHPNATQFTLQLDDEFFGIWRQSIDRSQSIFCISNLSNKKKQISLLDINLISTNKWFDILSKKKIKKIDDYLFFQPYQTYWITNKIC